MSGWEFVSQQQATRRDPTTGAPVEGVNVTFRTKYGDVGTVFVPMSQYTPAAVQQAIGQQAAIMDQVHELKG